MTYQEDQRNTETEQFSATRSSASNDKIWEYYLTRGEFPDEVHAPWFIAKELRPWIRRIPSEPRCRLCYYPFEGIGGALSRIFFDIHPSRVNPYFCNRCEQAAEQHPGGAEVEVTILFADVRDSTSIAERMKPAEFSRLIQHFYQIATRVLFDTNAIVEKLVGDAVTGFYTPGFAGPEHARVAVEAARRILRTIGTKENSNLWAPVGIGLHTGIAYVGSVISDSGVANIAVLGDSANIGARLAALAGPGEIYLSQATAEAARLDITRLQHHLLNLKGRTEPVNAFVLLPSA